MQLLSQEPFILGEGDLIQVMYRCEKEGIKGPKEKLKAEVLILKGDYLFVNVLESRQQRIIPWNCVQKWWIGEKKLTVGKSISMGSAIGLGAGFALGAAIGSQAEFIGSPATTIGSYIGAPAGLLIGAIIGAVYGKKNVKYIWHRKKHKKIKVEPKIDAGAIGIGLTLMF